MAANLSPKTVPQFTFTTISTRSPAQPQSGESDRAHFELLSHGTFAKLVTPYPLVITSNSGAPRAALNVVIYPFEKIW